MLMIRREPTRLPPQALLTDVAEAVRIMREVDEDHISRRLLWYLARGYSIREYARELGLDLNEARKRLWRLSLYTNGDYRRIVYLAGIADGLRVAQGEQPWLIDQEIVKDSPTPSRRRRSQPSAPATDTHLNDSHETSA